MSVPVVRCASADVTFGTIAPAGFAILAALQAAAVHFGRDVVITAGTNGVHSGPTDPHLTGEAYDVRSNDLTAPETVALVDFLQTALGDAFFVLHELPGATAATTGEHIHIQRAKGTTYPPE